MWFWFSLIALVCWSGSDLFSKIGCQDADDKYSASSSINSWVWWSPLIYTIDAVMGCVFAFWLFCVAGNYIAGLKADDKLKVPTEGEEVS